MRNPNFPNEAIVVLAGGKIFKVVDNSGLDDKSEHGLMCVKYIDKDEHSFIEADGLYVESVNTDATAKLVFEAAHSIHSRLNRMNKV